MEEIEKIVFANFKKYAIENGLDKKARQLNLAMYKAEQDYDYEKIDLISSQMSDLSMACGPELSKAIVSVNNSRYNRLKTAKRKIGLLVRSGKGLFSTLTFTDDVLAKTSELTRRRYVMRFCKCNAYVYMANQDFGDEKGREHYHAVLFPKYGTDLIKKSWIYGFSDFKKIESSDDDLGAVARYITKLSYHSVKSSAAMSRIIYSRDNPDVEKLLDEEQRKLNLALFLKELALSDFEKSQNNLSKEELFKLFF